MGCHIKNQLVKCKKWRFYRLYLKCTIVKADFIGFIKIQLFWGRFSRISRHAMTANAWRVSLCNRYSNWQGNALTYQSEIVLQSDQVHHRFRSGCQQIDNLCFALMFNIDFDKVLIIECFYRCVTLEIQICWIIFSYSFTTVNTTCSTIVQWIANKQWKCSNRGAAIFELQKNPNRNRRTSARIRRLGQMALYEWAYR